MRTSLLAFLFVLLMMQQAGAQLCSGSLGDPIINISFGANNPGPLKPGVTNLSYTNTGCPNDGQYTITKSMSGCFGNSWYDMPKDHTGDAGGQFMLVNASLTPNDFYVDTVLWYRRYCILITAKFIKFHTELTVRYVNICVKNIDVFSDRGIESDYVL